MKYTVTSLFSGIGGLDTGFGGEVCVHKNSISDDLIPYIETPHRNFPHFVKLRKLNFIVKFQNDIMEGAKKIWELNNRKSPEYIVKSIITLLDDNYIFPNSDVIIGGFPCKDFSHCGKRRGFKSEKSHDLIDDATGDNNRGTLYKSFVQVVQKTLPKVFVAENVYGILTMKGNPLDIIINDFKQIGYDVKYTLIKCNEHGIPQTRWRVIIIGICIDKQKYPLQENWNEINMNEIECPIKHYFHHLLEPSETTDISQSVYSKAKKLTKGQGQKEINMDGFAPTIRAEHHGNIEFRRHDVSINTGESHLPERRLTVREAGLCQTFSPDFKFCLNNEMTSYKYIGNSVPPLLSYLIALKIEKLLDTYF